MPKVEPDDTPFLDRLIVSRKQGEAGYYGLHPTPSKSTPEGQESLPSAGVALPKLGCGCRRGKKTSELGGVEPPPPRVDLFALGEGGLSPNVPTTRVGNRLWKTV